MLSFEPELQRLRPLLGDATADALIARERREVFSLQPELRICAWAGAMLLATAAGLVLKNNLERIGPLALSILMAAAAFACYAYVWLRRHRAPRHPERSEGSPDATAGTSSRRPSPPRSFAVSAAQDDGGRRVLDDSILLLGALLVSANVAFIEAQFDVFGAAGHRHFGLVALLHGIGAYAYRSRTLLTLSLMALAAWLGVSGRGDWPRSVTEFALRAFGVSAIVLVWYALHVLRRLARDLESVFEHFAANVAAIGAFALMIQDSTRVLGCVLAVALGAAVVAWGFRTRRELFVIYGILYGVIAINVLVADAIRHDGLVSMTVLLSMVVTIATLFRVHAHFRREDEA